MEDLNVKEEQLDILTIVAEICFMLLLSPLFFPLFLYNPLQEDKKVRVDRTNGG